MPVVGSGTGCGGLVHVDGLKSDLRLVDPLASGAAFVGGASTAVDIFARSSAWMNAVYFGCQYDPVAAIRSSSLSEEGEMVMKQDEIDPIFSQEDCQGQHDTSIPHGPGPALNASQITQEVRI